MSVDLECLDEGSGMEATLTSSKAMRHKSGGSKFNATKLM